MFFRLSNSLQTRGLQPIRFLLSIGFPGKNTGVGCHFLLQEIFPTQGSNPCHLHWQADSLTLSHHGSLCCNIRCSEKSDDRNCWWKKYSPFIQESEDNLQGERKYLQIIHLIRYPESIKSSYYSSNEKMSNLQFKHEQRTSIDISPKKTCEQPAST